MYHPNAWAVFPASCPLNDLNCLQSTEDDTVDDWGADFVGQIILTPKKGSVWDGKSEDGDDEDDEGDDTEGLVSRCL